VSSWGGSPADRGWRYLRESLKRHDSPETDYRYTKTALETVLNFWSSPPPPWLIQQLEVSSLSLRYPHRHSNLILQEHHHDYLIRVSLRFGNLEQAIDYTLSLVRKVNFRRSHRRFKILFFSSGRFPASARLAQTCCVNVATVHVD
jgi:nuclear pore complex protein Nup160